MTIKYTNDHEWIRMEDDTMGVVGISEHAQDQLGELVFVELPEVDREVSQYEEVAVVESVKAASEVKSPASGTITEVNESLNDEPEKVNADAEGSGWIYKIEISDAAELDDLMDEDAYKSTIE